MIHPLYVLGFVMFLGIVAWPVARAQGYAPRSTEADLIAVVVLILIYMTYKNWWGRQQGK